MDQASPYDENHSNLKLSIEVASQGHESFLSGLSADEREYELNEILIEHHAFKTGNSAYDAISPIKTMPDQRSPDENTRDSMNICDRLYHEAKEKEYKRANIIKEKVDQENNVGPPKLRLAADRSYTPIRSRPICASIHDHLYNLSKIKDEKKKYLELEEINANTTNRGVLSAKQSSKVAGRLYDRSRNRQEEGRKKRENIKKKLTPRAPTPSRKISLSKATAIYDRGISHKAKKERKIEDILNTPTGSTFPKMKSQTKGRSSSSARSQTPSRRLSDGAQTPSRRYGETPYTPSRHRADYNNQKDAVNLNDREFTSRERDTVPPPPPSMKTREQYRTDYKNQKDTVNSNIREFTKKERDTLPPTTPSMKCREQS